MGHAGLALSTSMVALLGAAILFAVLRLRIGGMDTKRLAGSAAKIAAAAAVMGAACYAFTTLIHALAGAGKLAQLADVAISIPLGASIFYAAARFLRIEELEAVRSACYTALRNAPRPEVGDPPARNR
jgi:putative peptidoglycan lipid II flippase